MKATTFAVMLFAFFTLSAGSFAESGIEYGRALKYYDNGQYREAAAILQEYVKKKPEPSAYYRLGYALYELGRYDEATGYFKQAYLIDPQFSPEKSGIPQKYPERSMEKSKGKDAVGNRDLSSEERSKVAGVMEQRSVRRSESSTEKTPSTGAGKEKEMPAKAMGGSAADLKKTEPGGIMLPPVTDRPFAPVTGSGSFGPGAAGLPLLAILAGMGTVILFFEIALYIFFSLCLFLIAKKLEVPSPWIAFIPLVQIWTLVSAAGKPWWWLLLLLVPVLNFFVGVYLWICVTENLGRNKWLGLLMLLPVVNVIFLGVIAFSKSERTGSSAESATPA